MDDESKPQEKHLPPPIGESEEHESKVEVGKVKRTPRVPRLTFKAPKILGLVALCVVSSAATAWLLLASGLVKPDATQTITQNRDKIVLQEGEIVADVFKQVSPSTVAITTVARTTDNFFGGASVEQGAGSGMIISKDGYVLTNKHVVPDGTQNVTVVLADGRQFTNVTVVGRDPFNDIAFLKIAGANNLPAAKIGDSGAVQTGQRVVAIGNALGEFRNSVTSGIISGIGRPIQASDGAGSSEQLENLLQTDAAINPGNSGGPLVNLSGEVIGINTAIAEQSQGIGFAIPINDAKGMISTVIAKGKIVKPYLGIRYVALTQETAKQLGLSVSAGAYINGSGANPGVIAGSPADKAGLHNGDIITKINGHQLSETSSLASALAQYVPGDQIKLTIIRDGKEQIVSVTLEAYPGL
jgi:serine protease Do